MLFSESSWLIFVIKNVSWNVLIRSILVKIPGALLYKIYTRFGVVINLLALMKDDNSFKMNVQNKISKTSFKNRHIKFHQKTVIQLNVYIGQLFVILFLFICPQNV